MSDNRPIAKLVDQNDVDALAGRNRDEVDAAVISELVDQETGYPAIDADRLISLGVTLYLAGQQRVDLAATQWLRQRRTIARLDLVSLLLSGVWRSGRTTPAVHPDALRELVDAHTELAHSSTKDSEHSYRVLLDYAVRATQDGEDETTALARRVLQAELEH